MGDKVDNGREQEPREVEAGAERAATGAREFRDENERAMHGGGETDYPFRLPPDVAEADRLRAGGDVKLADRQEQVARDQARAAETLRLNAETIRNTARSLAGAGDGLRENRDGLRGIREDVDVIRRQVARAREQLDDAGVPDANPAGDPGRGAEDGERGGG